MHILSSFLLVCLFGHYSGEMAHADAWLPTEKQEGSQANVPVKKRKKPSASQPVSWTGQWEQPLSESHAVITHLFTLPISSNYTKLHEFQFDGPVQTTTLTM